MAVYSRNYRYSSYWRCIIIWGVGTVKASTILYTVTLLLLFIVPLVVATNTPYFTTLTPFWSDTNITERMVDFENLTLNYLLTPFDLESVYLYRNFTGNTFYTLSSTCSGYGNETVNLSAYPVTNLSSGLGLYGDSSCIAGTLKLTRYDTIKGNNVYGVSLLYLVGENDSSINEMDGVITIESRALYGTLFKPFNNVLTHYIKVFLPVSNTSSWSIVSYGNDSLSNSAYADSCKLPILSPDVLNEVYVEILPILNRYSVYINGDCGTCCYQSLGSTITGTGDTLTKFGYITINTVSVELSQTYGNQVKYVDNFMTGGLPSGVTIPSFYDVSNTSLSISEGLKSVGLYNVKDRYFMGLLILLGLFVTIVGVLGKNNNVGVTGSVVIALLVLFVVNIFLIIIGLSTLFIGVLLFLLFVITLLLSRGDDNAE